LLEEFDTFVAAEVAVALERRPFVVLVRFELLGDIFEVEPVVAVYVSRFVDDKYVGGNLRPPLRLRRLSYDLVFIAGKKGRLQYQLRVGDG
jgi:hypothetical protein